jgi:hypothetical protein
MVRLATTHQVLRAPTWVALLKGSATGPRPRTDRRRWVSTSDLDLLLAASVTALTLLANGLLPRGTSALELIALGTAAGALPPPLAACVRTCCPAGRQLDGASTAVHARIARP